MESTKAAGFYVAGIYREKASGARADRAELLRLIAEIARLGEGGLKINDSEHRYKLETLPGDFSGLQLLCMMHVGLKNLDPDADSGSGLEREYELAKNLEG